MKKCSLVLIVAALATLPVYAGPMDVVDSIWTGIADVFESIVETVQEVFGEEGNTQSFADDEPGPPNAEIPPNMDPNG